MSRSMKPKTFMSLSLSDLSQSGPPKSVGIGVWGRGGGQVVYYTSCGQYRGLVNIGGGNF